MSLTFKEGSLICEDENVLEDFNNLIKENYGSELTWNEAYRMIDWSTVPNHVEVLNFGNVLLEDDYDSGWDGAVNAIWYDDNAPGEVIKIFHRLWANKKICDCYKMNIDDIKDLGREEVMQNLLTAKLYKVKDKGNKDIVDDLIKEYLRCHTLAKQ